MMNTPITVLSENNQTRVRAGLVATRRHLLHVFPSFRVGGSAVRFATIANYLGQEHRHTIVALDGAYDCAARLEPGVVRELVGIEEPDTRNPIARLFGLRARLGAIAPDLLVTYNWGAIEWALANRIWPVCRHVHFEDGFSVGEADRQFRRRVVLRRIALSGNSRVVVPSLTLHDIARRVWKLAESRVIYVPNGVDCDRFAAPPDQAYRRRLKSDPGVLIIGTVAALRPEKNIARLIRSVAPLRGSIDFRLVIAGDGSERPALTQLAEALGLADRVIFLGTVSGAERVLPLFDVFALSSDTEQMPLSVLEAMAAGLPVAGSDVGDVKAMLPDESRRHIVPRDDEAALTQALAKLLGNDELRRSLGRLNQAHVRAHYAQATMLASYHRLFST
jgi:L-malate glycosyltransferase